MSNFHHQSSPNSMPLFKFGNFRIYIASFMPCAKSSLSFSTILALSQTMTWFSFTEWSVRAEPHISLCECLFLSLVYTIASLTFSASDRCSLTRTFNFLFVSPIYFLSQPLQSMVYTPSLGSVLSLGWTRRLFRVECGFMAVTIPLFYRSWLSTITTLQYSICCSTVPQQSWRSHLIGDENLTCKNILLSEFKLTLW